MAEIKSTDLLVLTFHDNQDEKDRRVKIPNPRKNLTSQEVRTAMDRIVETKYFWRDATPKSAKIVKTKTGQIDITVE